jgi:hypothetical protein
MFKAANSDVVSMQPDVQTDEFVMAEDDQHLNFSLDGNSNETQSNFTYGTPLINASQAGRESGCIIKVDP